MMVRPRGVGPPLILFDLDETLIDRQYRLNTEEHDLIAAFRAAIEKGFSLGLNSDTSYDSLLDRHRSWGMNGPIAAERGTHIVGPDGNVEFFASSTCLQFPRLRDRFIEELSERADIVRFSQVWQLPEIMYALKPGERAILIDPHRKFSLSFWVRCRADRASAQAELLHEAVEMLEKLTEKEFPDIDRERERPFDVDNEYGVCIVHLRTTTKSAAVRALADRSRHVFMVGNSRADWIDDPRVTHAAVANSDLAFKDLVSRQGGLLATEALTRGALNLLGRIVDL